MNLIDKALTLLKEGANRVEFEYQGHKVVAYKCGTIIRIDVK